MVLEEAGHELFAHAHEAEQEAAEAEWVGEHNDCGIWWLSNGLVIVVDPWLGNG